MTLALCDRPEDTRDALDEYIYIISHDLRAELRALRELPSWIAEDIKADGKALSPEVAENIALLIKRAERLDQMMDDLLVYSRAGSGRPSAPTSLTEAYNQALAQTDVPPGFKIAQKLHGMVVLVEKTDLVTLFSRLIHNAVAHHHQKSGTVSVLAQNGGRLLQIDVIDDGPGIKPADRIRALKAMTALHGRRAGCGSGMGLPICQKIAESYDGALRLMAGPGNKGLHVQVTLLERS